MQILALETIDRRGSIAALTVQDDHCEVAAERQLPEKERTARTLVSEIDSLVKECDWNLGDLNLVCVATGPGSFTGLRIGVTTAKSLAYGIDAALVGVHSLSTMHEGLADPTHRVWTILDAQRQELFAACFQASTDAVTEHPPETQLLSEDDWIDLLMPGDLVCGPPLKELADRIPSGVNVADSQLWSPTAASVGRLGYRVFQTHSGTDPMQLVPCYYRKSAAEEKADASA